MYITESLCYTAEINTTLEINYSKKKIIIIIIRKENQIHPKHQYVNNLIICYKYRRGNLGVF